VYTHAGEHVVVFGREFEASAGAFNGDAGRDDWTNLYRPRALKHPWQFVGLVLIDMGMEIDEHFAFPFLLARMPRLAYNCSAHVLRQIPSYLGGDAPVHSVH
jgi:hypothetical protein